MIRSTLSFLPTKARQRSLIQVPASPIPLGSCQLCTRPAGPCPISESQSPHPCTKRGWSYISAVHSSSSHGQGCPPARWPSLYLSPRQKEEKKLALGVWRGRAAPSCQGARLLPGERTAHKSQDGQVPPPRHHSYPATPLPKHGPRPGQGPPPGSLGTRPLPLSRARRRQRPHCAEVETEAGVETAGFGLRAPSRSQGGDRSPSETGACGFHVGETESSTGPEDPGPPALPTSLPIPPTEKLRPSEGPEPARAPARAPPRFSPAGRRSAGCFLELSGKQRPPIRARGGAELFCIIPEAGL